MKTKYENNVKLTVVVSNGTDTRPAVKKVSDKMTVIRVYQRTGKNQAGEYNKPIDYEVQIFTGDAKTPTVNELKEKPKGGDLITVEGQITSRTTKGKDGKEYNNLVLIASKISPAEVIEDEETPAAEEESDAESAWG